MHDDAYIGGRSENNINESCILALRVIFCFRVMELIRFFYGAIQLL